MILKVIVITTLVLVLSSIVISHIIESENELNFNETTFNENLTYYSYHIHVYFSAKNVQQQTEAISLRNRFINEFHVDDCNDHCDTWCPRICHWDFNMLPVGPHKTGSWGVYIPLDDFVRTVSFISMFHGNLSVLVHPNSGRPKIDHLLNALWIKSIRPLNKNQLSDSAPFPYNRTID